MEASMKTGLVILAVAVLIPVVATGQSAPVAAGTRVRVTAPGNNLDKYVATVVDVRGDSIVVNVRNSSLVVGLAEVTELEVSTGKRTQFWRSAGYGLGLGIAAGALVGAVTYKECESDHFLGCMMAPQSASESAAMGGILFGALGFVGGSVVGMVKRTDRWASVTLPVRASIAPVRSGGVSVMLSRAF
jgi:hypothetical protein